MATPPEISAPDTMRCYRHPGRETLVSCSSCGRPICTDCMTSAAVGFRCPECAGTGSGASAAVRRLPGVRSDTAIATMVLVGLSVLVYLVEIAQGGGALSVSGADIIYDWGLFGPAVADGEYYRIVTAGFLHGSLIHLGFNMYLLWILGGALERYAGTARMLAIYFSSLLWGSALVLVITPNDLTIGASGAVFGLMAAMLLLERQRGIALLGSSVGALLLINLLLTFTISNISIGGHIGGLLGGAAAGFILSGYGRGHMAYGRLGVPGWSAVAVLMAAAVAVCLVAA
jgi:membrane associated rhomboid family serine protease